MMTFQHSLNTAQPLHSLSNMKQSRVRAKGWKQRSFNIHQSRIPDKEQITNSMLAYSQKMHEMSNRKVFVTRYDSRIAVPLLVKATQLEHTHKSFTTADIKRSKKSIALPTSKSHTLPNMRLEPLLGNRDQFKLNSASFEELKTLSASMRLNPMDTKNEPNPILTKGVHFEKTEEVKSDKASEITYKASDYNLIRHDNSLHDIISVEMKRLFQVEPLTDRPPKPIESILVMNKKVAESVTSNNSSSSDQPITSTTQTTDFPDQLPPLHLPRRRLGKPRRSRRMKLHKPDLGVIEESEEILRLSRTNTLTRIISRDLIDPIREQDTTPSILEEKRQEVVLHKRRQQSGSVTTKESSQLTMQNYAKKKVRQLAPFTPS